MSEQLFLPNFKPPTWPDIERVMQEALQAFAEYKRDNPKDGMAGLISAPLDISGVEYRLILQTNESYLSDLSKLVEYEREHFGE